MNKDQNDSADADETANYQDLHCLQKNLSRSAGSNGLMSITVQNKLTKKKNK